MSFCAYSAHRGMTICYTCRDCPTQSTYRASERPQEVLTAIRKTGVVYRIVAAGKWLQGCMLFILSMQDRLRPGIVSNEIFCHISFVHANRYVCFLMSEPDQRLLRNPVFSYQVLPHNQRIPYHLKQFPHAHNDDPVPCS